MPVSALPHSKKAFSYVQVECYPDCVYGYASTLVCFPEIIVINTYSVTYIHTYIHVYVYPLFQATCRVPALILEK